MTSSAIEAEGLVKTFGKVRALDGIDLVAREGTVFGLLGPNGAGKTTAIRVLSTLLRPDAGRAIVGGYDVVREPAKVRGLIGLTGQYAAVDELLSGQENLYMIGRLLGMPAGRRPSPGGRTARGVRPVRCRDEVRQDVLGRHAPAPRPRGEPGRAAAAPVPGRADHGPRPAEPDRALGDDPNPRRRGHHRAAHDAVPGGGRPARRRDRGDRPREGHRRGDAPAAQDARRRPGAPGTAGRRGRPGGDGEDPCGLRGTARARRTTTGSSSRSGSTTGRRSGRRSASSTTPGSWSTTCRCAGRASTRSSSPSPGTSPRRTSSATLNPPTKGGRHERGHRRARGAAERTFEHAHDRPPQPAAHQGHARAAGRDDDPADHVPGPVRVRVRRRDRRLERGIPAVRAAGDPRAGGLVPAVHDGPGVELGLPARRHRPFPLAADRPLGCDQRPDRGGRRRGSSGAS